MGRNDEITYASCFVHEFYNRVLNLREWIFHEIQVRAWKSTLFARLCQIYAIEFFTILILSRT